MSHTRRNVLAAGATGLTLAAAATGNRGIHIPDTDRAVTELIQRSEKANDALMRGDIGTYLSLITISEDFTLMSPFGGQPSRGLYTREEWDDIGKYFKNGGLKQQLVSSYGSADIVVLAVIEYAHGEVGGLPSQEWPLRVTLVYRRNNTGWQLVHRHADPLVKGITLSQSAALARGDKSS